MAMELEPALETELEGPNHLQMVYPPLELRGSRSLQEHQIPLIWSKALSGTLQENPLLLKIEAKSKARKKVPLLSPHLISQPLVLAQPSIL